jgi:hypothetical protein
MALKRPVRTHHFESKRLRPCGVCGRDIDLCILEDGKTSTSFCRHCEADSGRTQNPLFALLARWYWLNMDGTQEEQKQRRLEGRPSGREEFLSRARRLFFGDSTGKALNKKQQNKAFMGFLLFLASRPRVSWIRDLDAKDKRDFSVVSIDGQVISRPDDSKARVPRTGIRPQDIIRVREEVLPVYTWEHKGEYEKLLRFSASPVHKNPDDNNPGRRYDFEESGAQETRREGLALGEKVLVGYEKFVIKTLKPQPTPKSTQKIGRAKHVTDPSKRHFLHEQANWRKEKD